MDFDKQRQINSIALEQTGEGVAPFDSQDGGLVELSSSDELSLFGGL